MEGAAEPAGVGMADMVKACFVKTDIVMCVCVGDVQLAGVETK